MADVTEPEPADTGFTVHPAEFGGLRHEPTPEGLSIVSVPERLRILAGGG